MYLNRANIELINRLKALWGPHRFAQTNSRRNGCFLKHVRLYDTAEDKKLRRKYRCTTFYDKKTIERALDMINKGIIFTNKSISCI